MAMGHAGDGQLKLLRRIMWTALILVTGGLFFISTWGAWISSGLPQMVAFVAGMELIAFAGLTLAIFAPNWKQVLAGMVIFGVAVWVCIENAKEALAVSYSETLDTSASALRAQADQRRTEASRAEGMQSQLNSERLASLEAARDEEAALMTERDIMLVNVLDPDEPNQQVRIAQQALQAQGLYAGELDGIYGPLTRQAMLSRGSQIARELSDTRNKIEGLENATDVLSAQADKELEALALDAQADEADARLVWIYRLLIGGELARSMGLWAFLVIDNRESAIAKIKNWRKDEDDEPELDEEDEGESEDETEPEEEGDPVEEEPDEEADPEGDGDSEPEDEPESDPDPEPEPDDPEPDEDDFDIDGDEGDKLSAAERARKAARARWHYENGKRKGKAVPVDDHLAGYHEVTEGELFEVEPEDLIMEDE